MKASTSPLHRRYAVLTEGFLADPPAKTAHGLLHFRPKEVAVVVDSAYAGRRVSDVLPYLGNDAPIVASIDEALAFHPTSLLIGIASAGGYIPETLRPAILTAIDAGLEIVSGLHQLSSEDPEFVERAAHSAARFWDVRVPPKDIPFFSGSAYAVSQPVVLAIGSDCAVGKMTAMLEIERAANQTGTRARFVATGQTGIIITGSGIAVDRVISDFVTGAAEQLVLDASKESDVILVEGQGSIFHPAYAPVTFGLLYGSAPDVLVLCHRPGSKHIRGFEQPIPELSALVRAHETILEHIKPARVAAIALDTSALDEQEARVAIASTANETGLPVDDPVRHGGETIWSAIVEGIRHTAKARLSTFAPLEQEDSLRKFK